ncbi:unnamed protein product, partial [marine sediment metagenome]
TGRELEIFYADYKLILGLIILVLITGLLAGSYPSFYLSSFIPVKVLKTSFTSTGRNKGLLRKTLTITQFTLSIFLILCTAIIFKQLNYIKEKDLGFDKNNIIHLFHAYYLRSYEAKKNELLQHPGIISIGRSFNPLGTREGITDIDWAGKTPREEIILHPMIIDYGFMEMYGLKMIQGRYFSNKFPTDSSNYILNETAAKALGVQSPVGKQISVQDREGTIIGIVKDFHQGSLHNKIAPLVLSIGDGDYPMTIARLNPDMISETLDFIE